MAKGIYDQACDAWNDFVQSVFIDWCEENEMDEDDPESYEEFLDSDENAELIRFSKFGQ